MEILNQTSSAGESLLIKSESPITGLLTLSTFQFFGAEETSSLFYTKQYRISTNAGVSYTPWKELTSANLSNEIFEAIQPVLIEYTLVHNGTGTLCLNSIELEGTATELFATPEYSKSIFAELFTQLNPEVLIWAATVTEKAFNTKDVLHRKVRERGSKDFEQFFYSITVFFAFVVKFGREYSELSNNVTILSEFLRERGVFTNPNISSSDLREIANNYYKEFGKRGTADKTPIERLTNSTVHYSLQQESGWLLGKNSPGFSEPIDNNLFADTIFIIPTISYELELLLDVQSSNTPISVVGNTEDGLRTQAGGVSGALLNYVVPRTGLFLVKLYIRGLNEPFYNRSIPIQGIERKFNENSRTLNFVINTNAIIVSQKLRPLKNYSYGSIVTDKIIDVVAKNNSSEVDQSVKNKIDFHLTPANCTKNINIQ